MSQAKKNKGYNADFDTFWKEILDLIEPAVAFFLPDLHADVDWFHWTSSEMSLNLHSILYVYLKKKKRRSSNF